MEAITINQLWTAIIAIAGGLLTLINIYKFYNDKKKESKREHEKEINDKLSEIKEQNREQKEQLVLITRVVITMNNELRELGHINGKTKEAVDELNESLISK